VFQARWEGNVSRVFIPSQNRADNAAQERASRSSQIEKASFGFPGPSSAIGDAATGLPVTPVFPSRYATNEAGYLTVKFPKSEIQNPKSEIKARSSQPSTLNSQRATAELLSGSRPVGRSLGEGWLDGTGGWKPLELGEILARWNELKTSVNRE
jgi:hypothetical protein